MAPKLRISAGPDADHLEIVSVNHDTEPFVVDSDKFHGRLTVRIKDFKGEAPSGEAANKTAKYFQEPYGDGMTYSIQVQGTSFILCRHLYRIDQRQRPRVWQRVRQADPCR